MRKQLGTYTAVALVAVVAAAFAVPAFAGGKSGGGSNPSTIALNGSASFNNPASFNVVDPPVPGTPEMSVSCYQNGQQVFLDVQLMSGTSPYSPTFNLWSPQWATAGGGAANCTANLFYYTWTGHRETGVVQLAQDSFATS
jgi:hypothetical protein